MVFFVGSRFFKSMALRAFCINNTAGKCIGKSPSNEKIMLKKAVTGYSQQHVDKTTQIPRAARVYRKFSVEGMGKKYTSCYDFLLFKTVSGHSQVIRQCETTKRCFPLFYSIAYMLQACILLLLTLRK